MHIRKTGGPGGGRSVRRGGVLDGSGSTAPRSERRAAAPQAAGCTVGVSWNNYQEERWAKWDEPAIKAALAGRRRHVHLERRQVVGRDQATDVENLISQGAKVLIILAQDDDGDHAGGRRRRSTRRHPGHRL